MAFDYTNYYRLEYIGTTGTSYGARINTNYYPTNNTRIFFVATVSDNAWGFGCRSSGNTKGFYTAAFNGDSGKVRFGYNTTNNVSSTNRTAMVGTDVFFDFNKNIFSATYGNTTLSYTFTAGTFTCDYSFYFLSLNSYGEFSNTQPCTIKYGEIYESDVLLHRYYPAERKSDGEIGLYDDITDSFLTNAGDLEFTTGDRVSEGFDNSHYYELEYLRTDGNAYIDTYYVYNGHNLKFDIDLSASQNPSGYKTILGMYTSSSNGKPFSIWTEGEKYYFYDASTSPQTQYQYAYDGTRQNFVFESQGRSGSAYNLYLFKANKQGGTTYGGFNGFTIYTCKLYDNDVLVGDYVPAKRKSDSVLGLYNTVTGIFLTNVGSGTFTGGKRTSQDFDYNDYYELNYLQSDGGQWIDSGLVAGNGIAFESKVIYTEIITDGQNILGVNASSARMYAGIGGSGSKEFVMGYGGNRNTYSYSTLDTGVQYAYDCSFVKGNIYLKINGETLMTATTSPSYSNYTIYLFADHHQSNGAEAKCRMKMYYLRIYDSNYDLIRDCVPAERKSDGVLGLFDVVYGIFYTNSGSGSFISGGRIQYTITTAISPTGTGSISGGGTYYKGETAVLIATANSGFGFLKWNDETTNPTKTFVVFDDASYTAYFYALIVITLTYDSRLGSASYTWNGVDSIILTATPNRYGSFNGWYINNVLISTSNPYTYTVTQDTTIEARFSVAYDWIDPITDRTQADITAKNSKAYINATDLNRIEKDTIYLCYLLHEEYPALDNLTVKTNWVRTDIPSVNNMERIRANAETILRTLHPTNSIQTFGNQFNYENANDIEGALLTIYEEVNNA